MDTVTEVMIDVDVFIVIDTNADSWSGRTFHIAWCGSEEQAVQYLKDNYHHVHHAPDQFWWMEMERDVDHAHKFNDEVVRDFLYFQIVRKKISVPVSAIEKQLQEAE